MLLHFDISNIKHSKRYHMLRDRTALHPKTSGKFKIEELEEIIEDVLSQTGGRVDTNLPKGVDWDGIASKLNRATRSVYDVYRWAVWIVVFKPTIVSGVRFTLCFFSICLGLLIVIQEKVYSRSIECSFLHPSHLSLRW